ncbi:hypothetical protein H2200_000233 [Cladophialophora chaetospira]|uniref:Uncharacterized protein n=1 Tax=Cladophialophora chaetospira TaxID=386627 RepID=A0AA38XP33_9EURO|nr:hypothetical protein H2200_000233 [Cladophialophora chaetospira]
MTTAAVPNSEGEVALWECLSPESGLTAPVEQDVIGVLHAQGFELHEQAARGTNRSVTFDVQEEIVGDINVSQWLGRETICSSDLGAVGSKSLRLKVLLADQVCHRDGLRPDLTAVATRFSRQGLCRSLRCPNIALERLSSNDPWILDFTGERLGVETCLGMGTADFGMLLTKEKKDQRWNGVVRAVVIFFTKNNGRRTRFIEQLKNLRTLCVVPAFLPFLVLNGSLAATEERMSYYRTKIGKADTQLERFPDGRNAALMYSDATSMTRSLAGIQRDAKTMLRMVDICMRTWPPLNDTVNHKDVSKASAELKNVFGYVEQRLQAIVEDSEEDLRHISRQLASVLSIMAQAQQELSIEIARAQSRLAEDSRKDQAISLEIAEASKRIAEDTKRDGTSMKTLAVVTLVYLPATAVSSILAMPLFNWNAKGGAVVNPRFWIYVVLAVPLTLLTIGIWYAWLRMRRPPLSKASKT